VDNVKFSLEPENLALSLVSSNIIYPPFEGEIKIKSQTKGFEVIRSLLQSRGRSGWKLSVLEDIVFF